MQEERTDAAAQPDQSAGDQAEDVEMEEETTRASTPSALEENLAHEGQKVGTLMSMATFTPKRARRKPGVARLTL